MMGDYPPADNWIHAHEGLVRGWLAFFDPPIFHTLGPLNGLLVPLALFGALMGISAFEGGAKKAFIALAVYCCGNLIAQFLQFAVIGVGGFAR